MEEEKTARDRADISTAHQEGVDEEVTEVQDYVEPAAEAEKMRNTEEIEEDVFEETLHEKQAQREAADREKEKVQRELDDDEECDAMRKAHEDVPIEDVGVEDALRAANDVESEVPRVTEEVIETERERKPPPGEVREVIECHEVGDEAKEIEVAASELEKVAKQMEEKQGVKKELAEASRVKEAAEKALHEGY